VLDVLVFGLGLVLGGWWLAFPLVAGYTCRRDDDIMAAAFVARFGVRRAAATASPGLVASSRAWRSSV
jgi:hypothetical protein